MAATAAAAARPPRFCLRGTAAPVKATTEEVAVAAPEVLLAAFELAAFDELAAAVVPEPYIDEPALDEPAAEEPAAEEAAAVVVA